MVQQVQAQCRACGGEGQIINAKDRCKKCQGRKVATEQKVLEVFVDRGMSHGQKIPFRGEGDQAPGVTPGDVVIILNQQPHPVFERKGADLYMKKQIDLSTALTGGSFSVTHLDDRVLQVNVPAGTVIAPGAVKTVQGEGMPQYKRPFDKGNLIISFEINFPADHWIGETELAQLSELLPAAETPQIDPMNVEEVELTNVDSSYAGRQNMDEDDEDEEGGVRMCAQQ